LDFSFNRKTGTLLSKPSINSALLENKEDFNIKNSLIRIESPISDINSFVYALCSYNGSNTLKKLSNTQQKTFR
jgi:hypothetical protein